MDRGRERHLRQCDLDALAPHVESVDADVTDRADSFEVGILAVDREPRSELQPLGSGRDIRDGDSAEDILGGRSGSLNEEGILRKTEIVIEHTAHGPLPDEQLTSRRFQAK